MIDKIIAILIIMLLVISCNQSSNISQIRQSGIENDTTSFMEVYGGITLGADSLETTILLDSCSKYKDTEAYRNREHRLNYESYGLKGAWALSVGLDWRGSADAVATESELEWLSYIINNQPKYGSLQIDKYSHLDLCRKDFVIECVNEFNKTTFEEVTSWYTYLVYEGKVYSVVCIFDISTAQKQLSKCSISAYEEGMISLLNKEYGEHSVGTNCWIIGKYEINTSTYFNDDGCEIVLKYIDNKVQNIINEEKNQIEKVKENEDMLYDKIKQEDLEEIFERQSL